MRNLHVKLTNPNKLLQVLRELALCADRTVSVREIVGKGIQKPISPNDFLQPDFQERVREEMQIRKAIPLVTELQESGFRTKVLAVQGLERIDGELLSVNVLEAQRLRDTKKNYRNLLAKMVKDGEEIEGQFSFERSSAVIAKHICDTAREHGKNNGLPIKLSEISQSGKIKDLFLPALLVLELEGIVSLGKTDLSSPGGNFFVDVEKIKFLEKLVEVEKNSNAAKPLPKKAKGISFSPNEEIVYAEARKRPLNFSDLQNLIWEKSRKISPTKKEWVETAMNLKENGSDFIEGRLKNLLGKTYQSFKSDFLKKLESIHPQEYEKIKNKLP